MNPDPTPDPSAPFERRVLAARRAKDEYFAHGHHSPLPADRRHRFTGLAYFAPDPAYRLEGLRLEPASADDARPFTIETSDGRPRSAVRRGRLRFTLGGRELVLAGYRVGDAPDGSLFVPFRDATSGRETYGAGRYLDLEATADGTYTLDFNDAYHPYCAYSPSYSCPLPPAENRLTVPIEAGERLGEIYRPGSHW